MVLRVLKSLCYKNNFATLNRGRTNSSTVVREEQAFYETILRQECDIRISGRERYVRQNPAIGGPPRVNLDDSYIEGATLVGAWARPWRVLRVIVAELLEGAGAVATWARPGRLGAGRVSATLVANSEILVTQGQSYRTRGRLDGAMVKQRKHPPDGSREERKETETSLNR